MSKIYKNKAKGFNNQILNKINDFPSIKLTKNIVLKIDNKKIIQKFLKFFSLK